MISSRPLLVSSCIFAEDQRSETLCQSIIKTIKEKALLLDGWRELHKKMFDENDHNVPPSEQMSMSKLGKNGSVMTNNCNAARLEGSLICDQIRDIAVKEDRANGGDGSNVLVQQLNCHNHMRNTWFGALVKHMSKYLKALFVSDISAIDGKYCVHTVFDSILRAVDKEFSLSANYPKGHGNWFQFWLKN